MACNYASHFFKRHIARLGIRPSPAPSHFSKQLKVLFFIENSNRNPYYLENCRTIINILQNAEMSVVCVADIEGSSDVREIWDTASGNNIIVYNLQFLKSTVEDNFGKIDLIISNNDLVSGIPNYFNEISVPVIPPLEAGWHSRRKSTHFEFYSTLLDELSKIIGIDPWLISAKHKILNNIDITKEDHQKIVYESSVVLLKEIEEKYKEYSNTKEKPFLFLKSNYGTYGMGILKAESSNEFLQLNRKKKNKLYKGKGSIPVICYILQEGVPTQYSIDKHTAEICMYHVDNEYIGSFFRMNEHKGQRENLNSKNSIFQSLNSSKNSPYYIEENTLYVYDILSRILAIASKQEIDQLLNGIYDENCILDRSYTYSQS